jgi:hypothetical protein
MAAGNEPPPHAPAAGFVRHKGGGDAKAYGRVCPLP